MHPDEQERRKRGRRIMIGLLLLCAALPVGLWLYETFGPNPQILVAKPTTHLTTPLAADGLPDYHAVILARLRDGVTPQNNGAALFWRAMWDEYEGEYSDVTPEEARRFCREIGLPYPPPADDRIEPMGSDRNRLAAAATLRERMPKQPAVVDAGAATSEELDAIEAGGADLHGMPDEDAMRSEPVEEVLWGIYDRPWRREDLPCMADWLDRNERRLDLLVESLERPRWYSPVVGLLDDDRNDLSLPFANVQAYREAARLLGVRVFFHLGEGRHAEAWRHARATLRLACRTAEGPYWIDQLVAAAIGGVGLSQMQAIAADAGLPAEVGRAMLRDLDTLPPLTQMLRSANQGERFFQINMVLAMRGDPSVFSGYVDEESHAVLWHTRIDWNVVLIDLNNLADQIVAAAKLRPWAARQAAFAVIDADSDARAAAYETAAFGRGLLGTAQRSGLVSDLVNGFSYSSPSMIFAAEDRVAADLQLTKTAAALAVHRAEQGAYPESLDALVPAILPALPIDTMHGRPLGYRRTSDGYLLYHYGPNGADDGGSHEERMRFEGRDVGGDNWFDVDGSEPVDPKTGEPLWQQIPAGADDFAIRMPVRFDPWPWARHR